MGLDEETDKQFHAYQVPWEESVNGIWAQKE